MVEEIPTPAVEQAHPVEDSPFVAASEPPSQQHAAVAAEEAVTEANSSAAAKAATYLDDLQGQGSTEHGEDRSPPPPPDIEFRVSSRHLILASPFFKTALSGPWEEANSSSTDGCRRIYAADWDPQAFLILMLTIHGRHRKVPRPISLELLAKTAVLVDYYGCHEAVEVSAKLWLQDLRSQLPVQPGRDLLLWLCASWVFADADVFTSVTSIALRQSKEPLPTLGLPIPQTVLGR